GGRVYVDTGSHWDPVGTGPLDRLAFEAEGHQLSENKGSAPRRREIIAALKAATMNPSLRWGRLPEQEIAFLDGVLNLETGDMRPHEPEDYLERVIPWPFVPNAKSDLWDRCLPHSLALLSDPP